MIGGRAVAIVGVTLLVGAAFVMWPADADYIPIPRREDVWIPENAIVLDSAQIPRSAKAYVFQYDVGALGYSITMASVGKPSHLPGCLVLSGSAARVWWASPDTLMVEVTSDSYEVSQPPQGIVVVPTHAQKPPSVP